MKYSSNIKFKLFLAFALLFLIFIAIFGGGGGKYAPAFAETSAPSNVLDDLRQDKKFTVDDYPVKENDYSLQVMQIAESSAGDLLVYVYQPSADNSIKASSINIARELDNSAGLGFKNYSLEYQNSTGVFFKYKVLGFVLKFDAVRYYNISNIFRPFNKNIDTSLSTGETVDEVPNAVGQFWTACTLNSEVTYTCEKSNVVTITSKYVDFLRYSNGFGLASFSRCDSHYVAFSCDYDIEELYSADISFVTRSHRQDYVSNVLSKESFGDSVDNFRTLSVGDLASNVTTVIGGDRHNWKRIESIEEFKANETLSSECKKQLAGKQWVLRFTETEYKTTTNMQLQIVESTQVSEVTILRLYFKSNGQVYNLGVVDDKRTGDDVPGNKIDKSLWEKFIDFCKWLEKLTGVSYVIWAIIILAVPVCLLLGVAIPVLSAVFPAFGEVMKTILKGIWTGIKYFFIGLWWVITLPFRGIAALIRKIKGD